MIETEYVKRSEYKKHVHTHPLKAHGIWPRLKEFVPGWGYSKAEVDAFFEGESGGKKQVHWDRVTGKPGTFPPSGHSHAWADVNKAGSNLTDLATRQHVGLTDVTENQHHNKAHNILSAAHSDALVGSVARGDIIVGNSTPKWSRLAKGTTGQYLRSSGLDSYWSAILEADLPAVKICKWAECDSGTCIDNNVSTSRHGLFPKLSGKGDQCIAGDGAWLTLYSVTSIVIRIYSIASTNTRNSNDTERQSVSLSYVKLKETKMGEATGVMRIYFEMRSSDGSTVYGRIYKNGSPIGTERSTGSMSYVPFEENLASGLAAQDLIQIYAKAGTDIVLIRNLRFRYDRTINMLGNCVLASPLTLTTHEAFTMQNQDP